MFVKTVTALAGVGVLLSLYVAALPHTEKGAVNGTVLHLVAHNATTNGTLVRQLAREQEIGVCYKEVPTISLVKDHTHIPAGNGSAPGRSRIRVCCRGYERHPHIYRLCVPVCATDCVNAACTAPDTCTCLPEYVRALDGACVATCPVNCLNGQCYGNECICSPGFELDPLKKFCKPVCGNGCGHGNCTAPATCSCNPGYRLDAAGACEPTCGQCTHGDCTGPNTCVCHKGYAKSAKGDCEATCSKGCDFGVCVAPDVCACHYGYEKTEEGKCQPRCTVPCLNGRCTGPDKCTCNPGFAPDKTDPTGNRCEGLCPGGCPNGVCSGPNLCLCNFGYVKDRSMKGSQRCIKRTRRDVEGIEAKLTFLIPDY